MLPVEKAFRGHISRSYFTDRRCFALVRAIFHRIEPFREAINFKVAPSGRQLGYVPIDTIKINSEPINIDLRTNGFRKSVLFCSKCLVNSRHLVLLPIMRAKRRLGQLQMFIKTESNGNRNEGGWGRLLNIYLTKLIAA